MAGQDPKKFVPFSVGLSKFRSLGEGEGEESLGFDADLLPPEPVDYESIIEELKAENSKIRRELFDAQMKAKKQDRALVKHEKDFEQLKKEMEKAVDTWMEEVRQHTGTGLISALTHILQMPDVLDLALANRISSVMAELSAKKQVRVHVTPKQVEFAKNMLETNPQWTVISDPSIDSGALFKADQGEWDSNMGIAINETIAIIQAWLNEQN